MKKRLGLLLLLVPLWYFLKEDHSQEKSFNRSVHKKASSDNFFQGKHPHRVATSSGKTISEIIESDDVCSYFSQVLGGNEVAMKDFNDVYFRKSELATSFLEYENFHKTGQQPHKSLYARMLYHLAQAGLAATQVPNVSIDLKAAKEGLEELAQSEPTNSFYPILLLSFADLDVSETESMINMISKQNDFDSHLLSYAKEIAEADKGGAVSSMIKISHLQTLNIPDWTKISKNLSRKFQRRPQLLQRIGSLMMKQGHEADKTYWEFGFGILEYNTGRKLFPRKLRSGIPNANEINAKIRDIAGTEESFEPRINETCTEKLAKEYQDYFEGLRKNEKGLGIIL